MEKEISEDVLEVIKTKNVKADMEKDAEVQVLMEQRHAKATDIIRAHIEGKMDLETCVGMLMMKCHRSYETALLNIKLAKEYGCSSSIPYTGYGKKCEHHPKKLRHGIASDIYMDRSREYSPLPEQTGLYRQVEV